MYLIIGDKLQVLSQQNQESDNTDELTTNRVVFDVPALNTTYNHQFDIE